MSADPDYIKFHKEAASEPDHYVKMKERQEFTALLHYLIMKQPHRSSESIAAQLNINPTSVRRHRTYLHKAAQKASANPKETQNKYVRYDSLP